MESGGGGGGGEEQQLRIPQKRTKAINQLLITCQGYVYTYVTSYPLPKKCKINFLPYSIRERE